MRSHLVHAGVDYLESHMEVRALGDSQPEGLSPHQTLLPSLALSYQGRRHPGSLALLDGDGRLLRGQQPGGPQVVRPHLAVDKARADTVEGALQYGHALAGLGAGQSLGVATADCDGLVGGRVAFVGHLDVFPVGRN